MNRAEESTRILIEGRNAVLEALKSGNDIDLIMLLKGSGDEKISAILNAASSHPETKIGFTDKSRLDAISRSGKHQGVIAWMTGFRYSTVDDILKKAEARNECPLIFILDGIVDPHNLGAIIRTANLSGAHGVIIRKDRAASVNSTVFKTSAGTLNYVPLVQVVNIGAIIDELKQEGVWIYGSDTDGENLFESELAGPVALVLGNEGNGMSKLVKTKCDRILSIPMYGDINSLNVSVAAGILAYEVVRQRYFA